jgi:type VI secretion system secreted protein VgrG
MSDPVNEPSFRLDIAGHAHPFNVLSFTGTESISEPFVFQLHLLIDDPHLDLGGLMYRGAYLHFFDTCAGIHGQIHGVIEVDHGVSSRLCRVHLGPKLACLAQRFNQRIFTRLTVPEIISRVLREHGIREGGFSLELAGDYRARNYCTQYRESDLQFLQRLCAQEKIHYHFQHRQTGHCVVFADTQRRFRRSDSAAFQAEGGAPAIRQFSAHARIGAGECSGRAEQVAEGQSDLAYLRSGVFMPLSGHPFPDWNHLWLLTSVQHQGCQAQAKPFGLSEAFSVGSSLAVQYRNHFRATPWEVPFVPARQSPEPRMNSVQRAWVVEPAFDQAHESAQGLIAVQFEWLYQGQGSSQSHCWVPVSDELADETAQGLKAGMEVLVSFSQGDPDRPLIIGRLPGPLFGVERVCADEQSLVEDQALLRADISPAMFVGPEQSIQLSGGLELTFDTGSELLFKVGNSAVNLDARGLRLSSAQIVLEARQPSSASASIPTPPSLPDPDGMLELVRASHPLVLLCLLPSGGSFKHCKAAVCTCRALAKAAQSGAA